jgi:hypothetical protein
MFVGLLLVFAGCGTNTTIDTVSNYDESYDFSGKRTYTWMEKELEDVLPSNVPDPAASDRLIREIFDIYLDDIGFTKSEDPDFHLGYWIQIQDRVDKGPYDTQISGWTGDWYSDRYKKGGLVLDVVDAKTKDHVWRGAALLDFRPGEGKKLLEPAINKLLADFPPKN